MKPMQIGVTDMWLKQTFVMCEIDSNRHTVAYLEVHNAVKASLWRLGAITFDSLSSLGGTVEDGDKKKISGE